MKKNIVRVLSLVLAAAMLIACAACTQTINVRFVNKDGDDLDLSGIINANATPASNTPASETPASQAPASEAPASQVPASETPASQAPASETPASQAPASQAPASQAPASEAPASQAPAASGMPTGTEAIAKFYKTAVDKIKNEGAAGYNKVEWQTISNLQLGLLSSAAQAIINKLVTPEEKAKADPQISAKGSDDAKRRFILFTLTDYSKIASATCTADGSNYKIKIVMQDEDTPMNENSSFLAKVSNSVLYWENIEQEFSKYAISGIENPHVIYKGSTIEATITPDGNFVELTHTLHADIHVDKAKIAIITGSDIGGHLDNYAIYSNFQY